MLVARLSFRSEATFSFFPSLRIFRSFSSSPLSTEDLRIEGEANSLRIIVPLPSKGYQGFTLPSGQIRSFINDMKIHDSAVKDVDIMDANGLRLARSSNIHRLLENDWKLRINDTTYYVRAPVNNAGILPSREVPNHPNFDTIKKWLLKASEMQKVLDYEVYFHKCQDLGISNNQAKEILRSLTKDGVIFHCENIVELKPKIFLNPAQISKAVEVGLDLVSISMSLSERQHLLQQLKEQLIPLSEKRNNLLSRSEKSVNILVWSVLVGLCAQWLLFARLTWWEYSWDVIEPVTYFTTVVQIVLAGYVYYLVHGQEYTNMDMHQILLNWRFRKISKRANFDNEAYDALLKKVQTEEMELAYMVPEKGV